MIRAVLDVNVLVSGFPAPGGVPAALIERWLGREFDLVLSEHILSGVARAWTNAYFQTRYQHEESQRALTLLRDRSTMVMPVETIHGVADDDEDDLVLATAITGNAFYLVTGDRGLVRLETVQEVMILTPRAFLTVLERQERDQA
jgi:uncharacterized protein